MGEGGVGAGAAARTPPKKLEWFTGAPSVLRPIQIFWCVNMWVRDGGWGVARGPPRKHIKAVYGRRRHQGRGVRDGKVNAENPPNIKNKKNNKSKDKNRNGGT